MIRSYRTRRSLPACDYGLSLGGMAQCLTDIIQQQVNAIPDSPLKLETVVITAGYYTDKKEVSIGATMEMSLNFVDAIGQLIEKVVQR